MCIHGPFIHTCTTTYQKPKKDIPSWPSLCTLWNTRSKWEICVESGCFCCFQVLFSDFHRKCWHHFSYKKCHFSWKPTKPGQYVCIHGPFTHTCTTKYHQNTKIYLVGLPSVLYERPGQNERSVLNQLFLLFFMCFSVLFMYFSWKASLFIQRVPTFMRKNRTRSICVYTCTIYTYMHHQIPPKYDIPSWPSLCILWKTGSKWEICVESAVSVVFQVLFMCFSWKVHHFSYKKYHFSWKQTKPYQYVYIHVPFTHAYTNIHPQIPPKYKIYLVGLPSVLYKTPGQ